MPNDHHYSRERDDIMGKMPHWIIRWGITVVFVIFAGIIIGCWFIKYPQVVQAPIVITTLNPPADLIARYEGKIDTLFVGNDAFVEKGTVVALLYNTASYPDVCRLDSILGEILPGNGNRDLVKQEWVNEVFSAGDLQSYVSAFQSSCKDYNHYLETNYIGIKTELLKKQLVKNEEYLFRLRKQQKIQEQDLAYQQKSLQRDSLLLSQQVISAADFETSIRNMLQKENSKAAFDAGITSAELSLMQMKQQLIELGTQSNNEVAEYERNLNQKREELAARIASWKEQYVLQSPISGKITFIKYWSNNQRLSVGERLASVLPAAPMQVIGRANIPSAGLGKVKTGQTVNVKLNGYPYMEFGVLKGVVKNISAVPDGENGYVAEVIFPAGLTTTYQKGLNLIQQMDGTAEIITKDMRLIEQYLQPVRALFAE